MRLTAIQMSPSADKAANIEQASRLAEAAMAADRPDLIAFPEVWTCLGGSRAEKFAAAEDLPKGAEGGDAWRFLSALAARHRIFVHGGSIAERAGEKLRNTTLLFGPDGQEIARYSKIHLFDITAPDGTGYRESAVYEGGRDVVVAEAAGVPVGLSICYDLRFPELFLALRKAGAELIVLPAAFTLQTGKDHWEVLIRARAIETQCWVLAPACCGAHQEGGSTRFTWGHSLIVDPWGHVVARASDGPGWTTGRLDRALTARVRANMPVIEHRRL